MIDEVSALAARLAARWPTETALRAFADDLDDATGDLVVATLILGARRRGPGLARVLTAVADSVAEEVAMRRKVEAERAKPRTTARAVTLITLGVVAVGVAQRHLPRALRHAARAARAGGDRARVRRVAGLDARPDPVQPEPRFLISAPGSSALGSSTIDLTNGSAMARPGGVR